MEKIPTFDKTIRRDPPAGIALSLLRLAAELGLADGIITIPLTLILIRLMTQIRQAQDATRHGEVFA